MEKIAVLLADGMFHDFYPEKKLREAKKRARQLTENNRECRLFWTEENKVYDLQFKHGYDKAHYVLGEICLRSHVWLNTGKTLRFISDGMCGKCRAERYQEKYIANPEHFRNHSRQDYQRHKEKRNRSSVEWRKNNLDRAKIIVQRANARKRSDQSIHYTSNELLNQFAKFNNECAYCGKNNEKMTVDHVYPRYNGSVDCIKNIVPACLSCNSSKCNRDLFAWYSIKPFFTQERLNKIIENTAYVLTEDLSNTNQSIRS